jgi:Ser/Thr protein kinase RdoA (MazF antagonist)
MKDYETLTHRGQARRLRALASKALEQYAVQVASLSLAGWYTNTLFKVRTTDGSAYMLRLCAPSWRTETDLRSEVAWLNALAQVTDIGAPCPVATANGEYLPEVRVDGVSGARRCLLMSWVPGSSLEKQLSEENMYKMGVLFTRMHDHGETFVPPDGFTTRRMDRVLARAEADVLFCAEHAGAFTQESRQIFECTRQRVDEAYTQLYGSRQRPIVIHHDLWHGNINIHRGRLFPLDFEDTVWGFPVQDIAMAMQDLMMDVEPERYEPLLAAFRAGYEALRPWPEAYESEMDTFRAGRMLWTANHRAGWRPQMLPKVIEDMAPWLTNFLKTGKLRKSVPFNQS